LINEIINDTSGFLKGLINFGLFLDDLWGIGDGE
jgi:hypothetical protein